MNNEVSIDRELIVSIIEELEESLDDICPWRKNSILTESICNSCKSQEVCNKLSKIATVLNYTL